MNFFHSILTSIGSLFASVAVMLNPGVTIINNPPPPVAIVQTATTTIATTSQITIPITPTTMPVIPHPTTNNKTQSQSATSLQEQEYQAQVKLDTQNAAKVAAQQPKTTPQTTQQPAQTKNGYEICSEEYTNSTWDGTYTNSGSYHCVCSTGYVLNSTETTCQLPVVQSITPTQNNDYSQPQTGGTQQQNRAECQNATSEKTSADQQMTSLQAGLNAQIAAIRAETSLTAAAAARQISDVTNMANNNISTAALAQIAADNNYTLYCGGQSAPASAHTQCILQKDGDTSFLNCY